VGIWIWLHTSKWTIPSNKVGLMPSNFGNLFVCCLLSTHVLQKNKIKSSSWKLSILWTQTSIDVI